MSEQQIDYLRDPQSGGIVYDSQGPLWTVHTLPTEESILQEQPTNYSDLPAWCRPDTIPYSSAIVLLTGKVLLCKQCHLPVRKDSNGQLVAVIERRELTFIPEQYCACEGE